MFCRTARVRLKKGLTPELIRPAAGWRPGANIAEVCTQSGRAQSRKGLARGVTERLRNDPLGLVSDSEGIGKGREGSGTDREGFGNDPESFRNDSEGSGNGQEVAGTDSKPFGIDPERPGTEPEGSGNDLEELETTGGCHKSGPRGGCKLRTPAMTAGYRKFNPDKELRI